MNIGRSNRQLISCFLVFFCLEAFTHRYFHLGHSVIGLLYYFAVSLFRWCVGCVLAVSLLRYFIVLDPKEKTKLQTRITTTIAVLGLSVVTHCAVAATPRGLPRGSYQMQFDRPGWLDRKSGDGQSPTIRQQMLGNVVDSIVSDGHKDSILAKLGPPERIGVFSSDWDLVYHTGVQRDALVAIDSEWLVIWFDDSGHTSRWEIWSD